MFNIQVAVDNIFVCYTACHDWYYKYLKKRSFSLKYTCTRLYRKIWLILYKKNTCYVCVSFFLTKHGKWESPLNTNPLPGESRFAQRLYFSFSIKLWL